MSWPQDYLKKFEQRFPGLNDLAFVRVVKFFITFVHSNRPNHNRWSFQHSRPILQHSKTVSAFIQSPSRTHQPKMIEKNIRKVKIQFWRKLSRETCWNGVSRAATSSHLCSCTLSSFTSRQVTSSSLIQIFCAETSMLFNFFKETLDCFRKDFWLAELLHFYLQKRLSL